MRKIGALCFNELIKISKKVSVLVMLGIMIIGVFGFCGVIKMQEESFDQSGRVNNDSDWAYAQMEDMVKDYQGQIQSLEAQIKTADASAKPALEVQLAALRDEMDMYRMAIDKKIPLIMGNDYRSQALNDLRSLKATLRDYELIDPADRTDRDKKAIADHLALIARYEQLVDSQDFRAYLDIRNDQIRTDANMNDSERQIAIESNELWFKVDPTGGVSGDARFINIEATLSDIRRLKEALLNNLDYDSDMIRPLTERRRDEVTNELAVMIYRLENNLSTGAFNLTAEEVAVRGMFGFGIFMVILLMMILAGSAISQEMATGSIKSLIISPTRRWKIFTAKVLSLIMVGLAATALLYLTAITANGLFFGFDSGAPYVFASDGIAQEMNFYLFKLAGSLVSFIDVLVYMTLAFMLSIITRNTAAAVGISIAIYFGGSVANTFISLFARGEWLKFIPFNNMGLTLRFFPFDSFASSTGALFGSVNLASATPSLLFSLLYLTVMLICMGYTALDSFCRRDIR